MIDHTAAAPAPTAAPVAPHVEIAPVDGALAHARERVLRAHAAERARRDARLARLRLYSYCLTLAACVLALMSFMYLAQGTADGDSTFTSLGAMFVVSTGLTLWFAVRVTRVGEFAT